MNAAETIQAAVEKLETLRSEAFGGPWTAIHSGVANGDHTYIVNDVDGVIAYVSANDGSDEELRKPTGELIATLHRTADAQLAILRGFHDHLTNPAWDHDDDEEAAPVVVEVTALARAILGEAS